MKRSPRQPKTRRSPAPIVVSPQARRRQRSVKVAVRRDSMLLQSEAARHVEPPRLAPPRYTERRRARPGAGIKRSRANMSPRSR
jgi:hypothetical protein